MHGFRKPDGKVIRRYDLRAVFQAENLLPGHEVPTYTFSMRILCVSPLI